MQDDSLTTAAYAEAGAELGRLAMLPPGPALAAGLVQLRSALVSEAESVRVVALWARVRAWVDAQAMRALSDCCPSVSDSGDAELTVHEVAAMTHTCEVSTGTELALMMQVRDALPLCWEALDTATLTLAHVKALAGVLSVAPTPLSVRVEAAVVPQAVAAGWTPAELRRAARRGLITADPDVAAERAETARGHCDVRLYGEDHEMASVVATADAVTSRLVIDAIDSQAQQWKRDGDARPIGQLRIAALAGAVLGEQTTSPRTEVLVTIDLPTLLGLTRKPGELAGYGPITDETARSLARDATLRRLITDPLTHETIDLGRKAYRPSETLRRFITARNRTCRFPGCHRRAVRCDIDHGIDYDGSGRTDRANLHCLCRTHHNLKTHRLWCVDMYPDGSETWTSHLGFRYTKPPPRQPVADLDPPDDPYPTVDCPGLIDPVYVDASTDDEIPPGDPPPLDNEDREYTENLIEAQTWQRFDEAAYANYWQHRAAS
jgi:hypothetical protein